MEQVQLISNQIKINKRSRADFEPDEKPDGENDVMKQALDGNSIRVSVRR
jgi:hypothetical protein